MTVTMNGTPCSCEKGEFLLQIARRNGIEIPTLCHHEAIAGQGCCRLCIAEVVEQGRGRIVVSCVFPVERECQVFTESEKVRRERGMILRLLEKRAPESPEIKALCEKYAAPEIERFVRADGERCVLCGLCAKACGELGVGAISTAGRDVGKEIATPYHEPSSVCVGCGSCASVCPTGAIEVVEAADTRTIWGKIFQLVRCARCGQAVGTREELDWAARQSGCQPDALCRSCRQERMAEVFSRTYGE